MNEDMSQYLGVFLDEASEQMELLEQDILKLEQESSQELLQEIFRAAHTLKGSSRAMGFTTMGELTHAMEDVFDKLRHDEISVSREMVDALFAALDTLKTLKDEIAATGSSEGDTAIETARLRAVLEGGASAPETAPAAAPAAAMPAVAAPSAEAAFAFKTVLSEVEHNSLVDANESGCAVYGMVVQIAPDCIMKSVRALMVLQSLAAYGSVLATTPNEEGLENEAFEDEFEIVIASQDSQENLQKAAGKITEIRQVTIQRWPQAENNENPSAAATLSSSSPLETAASEAAPLVPAVVTPSASAEERKADAGPEGRGKPAEEVEKLAAEKTAKKPAAAANAQAQTVRVDVARLDKLLNLVGELVIDRTRVAQLGGQFEQQYGFNELIENLNETSAHIGRITDELQEEIMKARMLPIDNVFSRFPRMIRDLAQKLGKEVQFLVEGNETELDRSVIEVIGDPLIHMLRNSVDHGIEQPADREKAGKPHAGNVWLRARHEENHIVIEIEDDGKGLDPEKLRAKAVEKGVLTPEAASRMTDKEAVHLIFASGFSTAQVVSDVSGRGVGMDIVKSNLQKLGATIDIDSRVGFGSTFTVKLPLTLAIIRGLLITVRGCVYALPLSSVVETIKIQEESVHIINHQEVILQRGRVLPVVRLRNIFHLEAVETPAERNMAGLLTSLSNTSPSQQAESADDAGLGTAVVARAQEDPGVSRTRPSHLYLVVVGSGDKQVGLVVDALIGEQEVVIKTLGRFLGDIRGISGATILGDGRVALIVDINGLISVATEEKGAIHAA